LHFFYFASFSQADLTTPRDTANESTLHSPRAKVTLDRVVSLNFPKISTLRRGFPADHLDARFSPTI